MQRAAAAGARAEETRRLPYASAPALPLLPRTWHQRRRLLWIIRERPPPLVLRCLPSPRGGSRAPLGHGTPHAGLRGRDLMNGPPPLPLSRRGWVRRGGGSHNFNVRLAPNGRVRRRFQISRLQLLQIDRGGDVLPCIPLWQGSRRPELLNFGLQARRHSELVTTQRVYCIRKTG